jgi:hypothetical protein
MSAESHSLAVSIEWTLRGIFNCERFGLGGFINSDSIESNPMQSFRLGFASVYADASSDKKSQIDRFIDDNYQYEDMNIDTIGVEKVSELHEVFKAIIKE